MNFRIGAAIIILIFVSLPTLSRVVLVTIASCSTTTPFSDHRGAAWMSSTSASTTARSRFISIVHLALAITLPIRSFRSDSSHIILATSQTQRDQVSSRIVPPYTLFIDPVILTHPPHLVPHHSRTHTPPDLYGAGNAPSASSRISLGGLRGFSGTSPVTIRGPLSYMTPTLSDQSSPPTPMTDRFGPPTHTNTTNAGWPPLSLTFHPGHGTSGAARRA
jgi:hypothetical protein